ncbi:phosphate acyltransferase PlsX [Clostridium sp. D2Q-14]|uniref:phosphate acyltransferase PlsX n=1 Tax=Anaeromonas gelatinilytica TaxID=2683194 RepID=UPI00193B0B34|nr:phosphate acyltransferase PlsX [Anaeromonas gelatinilytica]MBS4536088.1 phosphate acyltransferase PlsX [Anaeromonas gelatinilytica]
MKIAIDAMSGDGGPRVTVKGSIDAVKEFGVNIILVGKEDLINDELNKYEFDANKIEVINASEVIANEDKPVVAIRKKKNSSMVKALKLVKDKEADAVVSAGNTGALLSGGLFIVGRIKGIDRPALSPVYPTEKGISLLIDAGANVDCKPKNLQQFGIMGSIYVEKVLNIKNPKVGLVNIGVEEGKGNELTKESFDLLRNTNINFYGNLEVRDIPEGKCDVLVCDGFVGNTILKLTEGLATSIFSSLKSEFMKSLKTKIGALLLKSGLKNFKKKMDYTEHGGALLLGVKGGVIKAHGSSDEKAIKNAIRQAIKFTNNNVIEIIRNEIINMEGDNG